METNERDILIKLVTQTQYHNKKLNALCENVKNLGIKIENQHEKYHNECDQHRGEIYNDMKKKVDGSLLKWFVGILIAITIPFYAWLATNIIDLKKDVTELKTNQQIYYKIPDQPKPRKIVESRNNITGAERKTTYFEETADEDN